MDEAPQPLVADVIACSFPVWHPLFRHCALRGAALKLPADFVTYLRAPGSLVLPSASASSASVRRDSGSEDEDFELRRGPDFEEDFGPRFPELDAAISAQLQEFGGEGFPKLSWTAPRDAAWINFCKSLKCAAPQDVYLLLKSSERVAHDLLAAFSHCSDAQEAGDTELHLVLKKWYDLRPEREIRAFVRSRRLIAACQRHRLGAKNATFLAEHRADIVDSLVAFFNREVRERFPRQDCVFDAYWTPGGRWKIIDFNPFGRPTDPRLFSWPELLDPKLVQNGVTRPQFRCEDGEDGGIVPQEMEMYGVPLDVIDLATGSDPHKFMDLLRESVRRQREGESSSDEED